MFAQMILAGTGIWLMFAPWVLGYEGTTAGSSDRIAGPAMAAAAFLAVFQITRGLRWFNLLTGVWLLAAPWLFGFPTEATVNSMICGAGALVLAPIGAVDQSQYGGGWTTLFRTDRLPWPDPS